MSSSLRDVRRFEVDGDDGRIGRMTDLLFDDRDRRVRHLVVDTGRWPPGAQRLVATAWIGAVCHDARFVRIDADRERMRRAPDFASAEDIDDGAERWLFHHYGFAPERG